MLHLGLSIMPADSVPVNPAFMLPKYLGIYIDADIDMEYDKATYNKRKRNIQPLMSCQPLQPDCLQLWRWIYYY